LPVTKSRDLKSEMFKGQASRPYNKTGTRKTITAVTSSEALLPIFPKIAFAARKNEHLA